MTDEEFMRELDAEIALMEQQRSAEARRERKDRAAARYKKQVNKGYWRPHAPYVRKPRRTRRGS